MVYKPNTSYPLSVYWKKLWIPPQLLDTSGATRMDWSEGCLGVIARESCHRSSLRCISSQNPQFPGEGGNVGSNNSGRSEGKTCNICIKKMDLHIVIYSYMCIHISMYSYIHATLKRNLVRQFGKCMVSPCFPRLVILKNQSVVVITRSLFRVRFPPPTRSPNYFYQSSNFCFVLLVGPGDGTNVLDGLVGSSQ